MLIIGIAGGTGSGKTTVVNQILHELPADEVCVISQDSYYNATHNLSYLERTKINFDHPKAIDFELLVAHITLLRKNEIIQFINILKISTFIFNLQQKIQQLLKHLHQKDVPLPYAANLEALSLPGPADVVAAAKKVCYKD